MKRLSLLLAATVLLSGCVVHETYREPYYGDGNYRGSSSGGYYSGGDGAYSSDGSYSGGERYYADDGGTGGDYYYGYDNSYSTASYVDNSFYYSLFWPLNHWYYDPFVYPGYRYGVTWFPRSYFSVSYSYGYGYSHYRPYSLAYSPYRYAWVDNYYDNRPWHHHHDRPSHNYDNYYPLPRYGSAHNEAERLAVARRTANRLQPRGGYGNTSFQSVGSRNDVRNNANRYPADATRNGAIRTPSNSGSRAASRAGSISRQEPGVRRVDDSRSNAMTPTPRGGTRPIRNAPDTPYTRNATPVQREASRVSQSRLPDRNGNASRDVTEPQVERSRTPLPQRVGANPSAVPRSSTPNYSTPPRDNSLRSTRAPERMERTMPHPVTRATPENSRPIYTRPANGMTSQPTEPVYRGAPQRGEPRPMPQTRLPQSASPQTHYSAPVRAQPNYAPQPSAPRVSEPPQNYRAPEAPRSSNSDGDSSRSSSGSERSGSRSSSSEARRVGMDRR